MLVDHPLKKVFFLSDDLANPNPRNKRILFIEVVPDL